MTTPTLNKSLGKLAVIGALAMTGITAQAATVVLSESIATTATTTDADGMLDFTTVPKNSATDLANGLTPTLYGTLAAGSTAPATVLTNGQAQNNADQVAQSVFFGNGNTGRIVFDLGSAFAISQVNTYSWHKDRRAPQGYTLLEPQVVNSASTQLQRSPRLLPARSPLSDTPR